MAITVSGTKDNGTATGGSTTTLVDNSKSWSSDIYAGYIVWDKATNETAVISGNTSNTLTLLADGAIFSNSPSGHQYAIGLRFADLVSAYTGIDWTDSDANAIAANDSLVLTSGFIGEPSGSILFTTPSTWFRNDVGSLIQFGYKNRANRGRGGVLAHTMHNVSNGWTDFAPGGRQYMYNSSFLVRRLGTGSSTWIRHRFSTSVTTSDPSEQIDCNWERMYMRFYKDDIVKYVGFSEPIVIGNVPTVFSNCVFKNCATALRAETTEDIFDATWSGVEMSDTNFNRPITYSGFTTTAYFWNSIYQTGAAFNEDTDLIRWLGGSWSTVANTGYAYFGVTVDVNVSDIDNNPVSNKQTQAGILPALRIAMRG